MDPIQPHQLPGLLQLAEDYTAAKTDRREFLKRATALGLSIPAATAFLAACGSSSSSSSSSSSATSGGSSGAKGGRLTYGPLGDAQNYDTDTNNYDYPSPPFQAIYEGLAVYPPGPNWVSKNLLAKSIEMSKDGKTYAFTLKEGIPFHHNFGEVTANEVKYSFERAAGIQKLYPGAPKSVVSYYSGDFPNMIGVKVTGKYSGEVQFKEPFAPFATLTLPFTTSGLIVPEKAVKQYGSKWPQNPIGTGPYQVASYTPNSEMVLEKFADYGGASAGLGQVNEFDEIRMVLTPLNAQPKGESLTVALESGEADFTPNLGGLDIDRLKSNSDFRTYEPPGPLNYFFLAMDVQNKALKDLRVRQAIRYAVDIPEIITANRMPADTRLNAQISKSMGLGYWADAPVYTRDVDKAKSLLAAAGATDLTLDIATPSISTAPGEPNQVMQVIQSQLKDVGINVSIIETPPDRYIAEAGFGALAWGFFGGAPDPYYQFEWFTCDQIGVWNFAAWCNKEFTSLEGTLATETVPSKRNDIAIQMQQIQDQDAPIVWIGTQILFAASKSSLQAVFDTNGNPVLNYFHTV